jgi:hypothetical protein
MPPCGGLDPAQPPLPLGHDLRLERGIPVPRHVGLHRPHVGQDRLGPVTVAGVPAIAAGRIMLGVAEMGVQLALESSFQDDLGEPAKQAARPGQGQALGPGPLGQLPASSSSAASWPPGSPSAAVWLVFSAAVMVFPPQTEHLSVLSQELHL